MIEPEQALVGWSVTTQPWGIETHRKSPRMFATSIDIVVYDNGDIEIESSEDVRVVTVPVAVLANHLRLMGWTVTPPASWLEERGL